MSVRPCRSVLYMPGSNARAIEKARSLAADALILDLEDAVAPDAKQIARQQVCDAVRAGGFGKREIFIRVNATDTPWGADDLAAAAAAAPDAILVPKISTPEELEGIGRRLDALGTAPKTRVWAMMETPLAMLNARDIAAARSPGTRLTGFVMGTNDLAIVDGVYNDIGNAQGFARECAEARDLGFDGKTLIHPSQIEPCNAAFSPSAEEVESARKILAAFDRPENLDKGVVRIDGRMVERLHAEMARRTVAIADAIAQSESA